jgi:HEAT repeats/Putative zinc-finger
MTMKCDNAHEYIAMAVYGDLADDQCHQLEQHLAGCVECRGELEGVQALAKAMSLHPVEEPTANLVARSRLRLEEALDSLPRASWLVRLYQRSTQGMGRLSSAPVAASAVLVIGLAGGGYGGYRAGTHAHLALPSASDPVQVANVSSIVRVPGTKKVEVRYDRLVPESAEGSLDDPYIRALLVVGARNRTSPGVRDDSVGLMAGECRAGHQCGDGPIRNALMVSLLYDNSPGVRLKALEGLQPYIADDTHVRDAVLQSLLNDPDTGVRTQAIGLLEPVQADSSVQDVLLTIAERDDNPQIRDVSQQVLRQVRQIQ